MKKKKPKSIKKQQKIDVALASLLNLETQMRELIKRLDSLETKISYYPTYNNQNKWHWW